jgi:hypothetical protein
VPIKRGDFVALLMCAGARLATGGNESDVDLRWDNGLLVGQPRPSSETQSETAEYAFNATIDTGQTAADSGAPAGPCPAG